MKIQRSSVLLMTALGCLLVVIWRAATPTTIVGVAPRVQGTAPLLPAATTLSPAYPNFDDEAPDVPPREILPPEVIHAERTAIETASRAGGFARAAAMMATLPDLEDRRQVFASLIEDWAKTDPEAAARFAQAWPAGVERQELLGMAIRAWSERDLVAASDWLNEFEPQPDYDLAVAAIASSEPLCLYQPETALSWAKSITASAIRWEVMSFVVTLWAQRNPSAVRLYIETSAVLTPEERTRMRVHVSPEFLLPLAGQSQNKPQ